MAHSVTAMHSPPITKRHACTRGLTRRPCSFQTLADEASHEPESYLRRERCDEVESQRGRDTSHGIASRLSHEVCGDIGDVPAARLEFRQPHPREVDAVTEVPGTVILLCQPF